MYIITVGEHVNELCNTARHVQKNALDEQALDINIEKLKKKIWVDHKFIIYNVPGLCRVQLKRSRNRVVVAEAARDNIKLRHGVH